MKRGIYRRVPGVGRSANLVLSAKHRLWLAPDHLLSVCNQGYSEDYKRFYFRDIQSIDLRQSGRGRAISVALACVALAFGILAGATALYGRRNAWDPLGAWILLGLGALFLLAMLCNMALGPTCVCTLRTAVQSERLYSLVRVRKALRALRMIREAVEAVQGSLPPELVEAYAAEAASSGASTTAREPGITPLTTVGVKPYRGQAHAVLFTVLLIDAYHSLAQFAWQSPLMYGFSMAILLALGVALIMAMIRQAGTDLPAGLKSTTWWTMGYMMVSRFVGAIVGFMHAAAHISSRGPTDQWAMLRSLWMTSPFESMPILLLLVFSVAGSGALGAIGWVQLRAFHRRPRPSAAAVPPLPAA